MAQLFVPPFQTTLDTNANPVSGAKMTFYASGTSTLAQIYADAALATPLSNPVIADSAGRYAPIYIDDSMQYRVKVADQGGTTIRDVDPYNVINETPQTPDATIPAFLDAEDAVIPDDAEFILVEGYFRPGDGGSGYYLKVEDEPKHDAKFENAGNWWELQPINLTLAQFGAVGEVGVPATSAVPAFNKAIAFARRIIGQSVFLDGLARQLPVFIQRGTYLIDGAFKTMNLPSGMRFIGEGPATLFWQTYHGGPIATIDPYHNYLSATGNGSQTAFNFTLDFDPTDTDAEVWVYVNGGKVAVADYALTNDDDAWTVTFDTAPANTAPIKVVAAPYDIHGAGFENISIYSPSLAPASTSCFAFFAQTANCILRNITCFNLPKLVRLGNNAGSASGFATIASGMRLIGIRGTFSNSVHDFFECISGRGLITDSANDLHCHGVGLPNQATDTLFTGSGDGTEDTFAFTSAYTDADLMRPYVNHVLQTSGYTFTNTSGSDWEVEFDTPPPNGHPVRVTGYAPVRTSTLGTVAGRNVFSFGAGTWDTAYIYGTYLGADRGLYVNAASGKFVGNIWAIAPIFDFNKTNGIYLNSAAGGNLGNIYIVEPYIVAWDGVGIYLNGTGNLFNVNVTGGKIAGAWEHGIQVDGAGTRQVRLVGINGYGINRNVNANAAMVYVTAAPRNVFVYQCGNQMEVFNQPYDWLPKWGIAMIAGSDHWQVHNNFFLGWEKHHNCETASTASANRSLKDNLNADYAGFRDGADFTLANDGGGAFSWEHKRAEEGDAFVTATKASGTVIVRKNGYDLFSAVNGSVRATVPFVAGDEITVSNADTATALFMAKP